MLSIFIVIVGFIALPTLPVAPCREIAPPRGRVKANFGRQPDLGTLV